jgi:hypothetical protein
MVNLRLGKIFMIAVGFPDKPKNQNSSGYIFNRDIQISIGFFEVWALNYLS